MSLGLGILIENLECADAVERYVERALDAQKVIENGEHFANDQLDRFARVLELGELANGREVDATHGYARVDQLDLILERVHLGELLAWHEERPELDDLFVVANVEPLLDKRERAESGQDDSAPPTQLVLDEARHGTPYLDYVALFHAQLSQ